MFVETATTLVKVARMIMITAAYLSFLDAKRGLSLDYNNFGKREIGETHR